MEITNKSTETFILIEKFQSSLRESCEKKCLDSFWRKYNKDLLKISNFLSKVRSVDGGCLVEYICHQFMSILELFVGQKLGNSSFFVSSQSQKLSDPVELFSSHLKISFRENNWKLFMDTYEKVFDNILHLARKQKVVDVLIERDGGFYGYFDDARKKKNQLPVNPEPSTSLVSFALRQLKKVPILTSAQKDNDNHRFLSRVHRIPVNNEQVEDYVIVESKMESVDGALPDEPPTLDSGESSTLGSLNHSSRTTRESGISSDAENTYYEVEIRILLDDEDNQELMELLAQNEQFRSDQYANRSEEDEPIRFADEYQTGDSDGAEEDVDQYLEVRSENEDSPIGHYIPLEGIPVPVVVPQQSVKPEPEISERSQEEEDGDLIELKKDLAMKLKIQNEEFERKHAKIRQKRLILQQETEQLMQEMFKTEARLLKHFKMNEDT